MKTKIWRPDLVVNFAAAALLATLLTPAASAAPENSVVDALILAESVPRGYFANAIVLEYDKAVDLRGVVAPLTDVTVNVTRTPICAGTQVGDSGPRTVVGVYSNSVPRRATTASKGKYLIIELSQNDANRHAARNGCPADLDYSVTWGTLLNRLGQVEVQASSINTSQVISPIIEDFLEDSYTSTTHATTLGYRLFRPELYLRTPNNPVRKYPLVLFLHGGGERGDNNFYQIAANMGATVWAQPEFQAAHPAFIVAPQVPLPSTNNWTVPNIRDTVRELVLSLMARYPIDPDRVYVQGLSMGSFGTNAQLQAYPELYAGALMVAGNRPMSPGPQMQIPAWLATAFDDALYPTALELRDNYLAAGVSVAQASWRGDLFEGAAPFAEALIELAEAQGSHILFTTYETGTNVGAAHNTGWIATYSNPVIREWLFSQRRQ